MGICGLWVVDVVCLYDWISERASECMAQVVCVCACMHACVHMSRTWRIASERRLFSIKTLLGLSCRWGAARPGNFDTGDRGRQPAYTLINTYTQAHTHTQIVLLSRLTEVYEVYEKTVWPPQQKQHSSYCLISPTLPLLLPIRGSQR